MRQKPAITAFGGLMPLWADFYRCPMYPSCARSTPLVETLPMPQLSLLECVRSAIRLRHYSIRTEEAYVKVVTALHPLS